MIYRLQYDAAAEAVHDALPPDIGHALTNALAVACSDPLGATEPYGHDDKVMRRVNALDVSAVVLLGHNGRTLTVLQINYLG